MPLLSCTDLTVCYGNKPALRNVSFCLEERGCLVVAGSNGSGKSTLMKALLGLVPVQGGHVAMQGVALSDIGYLPQQGSVQKDFPASVGEVVLSGCLNRLGFRPFYSGKERALAGEKMEQLGITDIARKSFQDLSGGQRQRVLLARALCGAKKMLCLDEPVAGLDPIITEDFYSLVKHLNRSEGLTVIMISHDIKRAVDSATSVLHMDMEVRFFGPPSGYKNSDAWNTLVKES